MYPISAVYSFPLPVSSGNIPGIPDVSPFRWGLPAPSESPENKIWPVTACFPVSGTYPCLSLLMKNLPEQSRRILPAYWHLENAQCSRFLTGCLPLRQYQFPASSSGYIESKAGCLLSPLPPPASVPGCKVFCYRFSIKSSIRRPNRITLFIEPPPPPPEKQFLR